MKTISTLLLCVLFVSTYGQPGTLDPTFGNGGKVTNTSLQLARAITVQNDGKLVLAGDLYVARYNANGTPDAEFGVNGKVDFVYTYGVVVQNDGKIVATGFDNQTNSNFVVGRFNLNGSPDQSFGTNGRVTTSLSTESDRPQAIALQNDGKIVVAGSSRGGSALARYTSNGNLDPSFGVDGKVLSNTGGVAFSVAIQPDGKIVTAGTGNGFTFARYNTNGSLDPSFDFDGRANITIGSIASYGLSVAIQPDGKIVASGGFYTGTYVDFALVRLNSNGSPDVSFDGDGRVVTQIGIYSEDAWAIGLQNDGKILAAGILRNAELNTINDFVLARYNADGSLDQTFGSDGIVRTSFGPYDDGAFAMKLFSNRIYVAGYTNVSAVSSSSLAIAAYRNDAQPVACLNDTIPPTIVTQNLPYTIGANGSVTIVASSLIRSLTDNCAVNTSSITASPSTITCADLAGGGLPRQAYISNTVNGNQNFNGELGLAFRVNDPAGIVISQLGTFDHQGNGITGTQNGGIRVAIFDKATKTIVPGLNTIIAGNADALSSGYRFKNIAPITLLPGEYVVIAKGYNELELNGNFLTNGSTYPAGDAGGGAISFLNTAYYGDNQQQGFAFPAISADFSTPNAFLAGTFRYALTAKVNHYAFVSNSAMGNQNYNGELGMDFRVDNPSGVLITQLGAFDHDGNGITGTQNGGVRVAIFNKVTRMIVPGLDAVIAGNADYYAGFFRYKYITPVVLPQGEYVVVAKGYNENELNGNFLVNGSPYPAGPSVEGIIHLNTTFWGDNNITGFSYPTNFANLGTSSAFLAGTFVFSARTGVTVTITAKDMSGNTATATAIAYIDDPLRVCNPAAMVQSSVQNKVNNNTANAISGGLSVFPNPTRGDFTVQLSKLKTSKISIEILNEGGGIIDRQAINLTGKSTSLSARFNLHKQPPGVYFVKVISTDGVQTGKVIIQR